MISERNLNTLIDYRYQQHHKAQRGDNGSGQNRTGKGGDDLILKVPIGTQVFEEDNKTLIYDFKKEGEKFVAAAGVFKFLQTRTKYLEIANLSAHNLSCFPVFFESLCLLDSSTCRGERVR